MGGVPEFALEKSQHKNKDKRAEARREEPAPGVDPTSEAAHAQSQEVNDFARQQRPQEASPSGVQSPKGASAKPKLEAVEVQPLEERQGPVHTEQVAKTEAAEAPPELEWGPTEEGPVLVQAEHVEPKAAEAEVVQAEHEVEERLVVAEQVIEGHKPEVDPEAQVILEALNALTKAQRVALVTGRHGDDKRSKAAIKRVRRMIGARLDAKLKRLNKRFKASRTTKRDRRHSIRTVGNAPKGRPGERDMADQAGIVASKLAFTHPDFKGQIVKETGLSKGMAMKAFFDLSLKDRLERVLKFSSIPGTSRHHWNTDVDLEDTKPKNWVAGDEQSGPPKHQALHAFLSDNKASLGLTRVYTPGRAGGYDDEAWHVTDPSISRAMLEIYMTEVDLMADVIKPAAHAILSKYRPTVPGGLINKNKLKIMEDDLVSALSELDLMSYVTEVNPEVRP